MMRLTRIGRRFIGPSVPDSLCLSLPAGSNETYEHARRSTHVEKRGFARIRHTCWEACRRRCPTTGLRGGHAA